MTKSEPTSNVLLALWRLPYPRPRKPEVRLWEKRHGRACSLARLCLTHRPPPRAGKAAGFSPCPRPPRLSPAIPPTAPAQAEHHGQTPVLLGCARAATLERERSDDGRRDKVGFPRRQEGSSPVKGRGELCQGKQCLWRSGK